ncbi:MAG: fatty acid desaturase, partial [Pseudobdellovibrio sp.]
MMKYSEDLKPVGYIMLGLLFCLAPFAVSNPLTWTLCTAGIMLRIFVPVHQHYHSHLSTFKSETLNALYDAALSVAGGNLTALWKVHHGLGHHVEYLDQHNDVEGNLRFGESIPYRRLVFTVLGDALSLYDSLKLLKKLPSPTQKFYRRSILLQLAIQLTLLLDLSMWNWKLCLTIFIIPNIFLRWSVFWFAYAQHDNLPMNDVYDSSTTKFTFNHILLNNGLHTAHHERPGLHWSKLDERTEQILPLI